MFLSYLQEADNTQAGSSGGTIIPQELGAQFLANIRVMDVDLRTEPDHELFQVLGELPNVLNFYLIGGSWNAIKVQTDLDLIEDTGEFTQNVLEPLRQLGLDVRLTHLG